MKNELLTAGAEILVYVPNSGGHRRWTARGTVLANGTTQLLPHDHKIAGFAVGTERLVDGADVNGTRHWVLK